MQFSNGHEFTYKCPYCHADQITFDSTKATPAKPPHVPGTNNADIQTRQAMAVCRNLPCQKMVVFNLIKGKHGEPGVIVIDSAQWKITGTFPEQKRPQASELLPPKVRKCMLEAEEVLACGPANLARIARGAFRTVLDVATKEVLSQNPACHDGKKAESMTLYRRIELLTEHHLLTPALRDWAHGVRVITNEDVHTVESVAIEEAKEVAEITRMMLLYLFELPARVIHARETAEAKRQPKTE